jgi:hypothetical protein
VVFQGGHVGQKLVVGRPVQLLQVGEGDRVTDARHHVFALGVRQVVAVDATLAGRRIAGERDSRAGALAEVAEDHRHDVHRGTRLGGQAVVMAVQLGARRVPGPEDRSDGGSQLLEGILGEGMSRVFMDRGLECVHHSTPIVGQELGVQADATAGLAPFDGLLEDFRVQP